MKHFLRDHVNGFLWFLPSALVVCALAFLMAAPGPRTSWLGYSPPAPERTVLPCHPGWVCTMHGEHPFVTVILEYPCCGKVYGQVDVQCNPDLCNAILPRCRHE